MFAFRRFFTVFLLCVILLTVVVPASTLTSAETLRELTVMHTNATFNRIQEFTPFQQPLQGGVARRATKIKEIRNNAENSLLVSAGNDIMGTPMFVQYGGAESAEIMSRLGYDVAMANPLDILAGGSTDAFKTYLSAINFPVINANLNLVGMPDLKLPPNTILTVNDLKVGVFGMASERSVSIGNFGESAIMLNTEDVIRENLSQFKEQDVDIVVMLSYLGVDRDHEIAEEYGAEGIDIIVGSSAASSNIILGEPDEFPEWEVKPFGPYPLVFNENTSPTVVVYAHEFGSYLGELKLSFDDKGILKSWDGGLHFLGEDVVPDAEMQKFVDELVAGITMDKIVIGEGKGELYGTFRQYPWQETPLGNLYADAFLEYGQQFGAKVALVNAGAVWGSLPKGEITFSKSRFLKKRG